MYNLNCRSVRGPFSQFCKLNRPNPWSRFTDTPHPSLAEGPLFGSNAVQVPPAGFHARYPLDGHGVFILHHFPLSHGPVAYALPL
jgi:hypothetical protein